MQRNEFAQVRNSPAPREKVQGSKSKSSAAGGPPIRSCVKGSTESAGPDSPDQRPRCYTHLCRPHPARPDGEQDSELAGTAEKKPDPHVLVTWVNEMACIASHS